MTVWVDGIKNYPRVMVARTARKHGTKWCHMSADSLEELIAFAKGIGLPKKYLQDHNTRFKPHFDLAASKRVEAIRMGAEEVTAREFIGRSLSQEDAAKLGLARA